MLLERLNGQPENVEFSIPCMSDYVGVVRLAVSGLATRMNFSIEEIEDIKIAVSEACTNSVQYAYENPIDERVFITFNLFNDKLEIIVKDINDKDLVENIAPWMDSYMVINDKPSYFVCTNFTCKQPTNDIKTALKLLNE